jgi:hypothetical protein
MSDAALPVVGGEHPGVPVARERHAAVSADAPESAPHQVAQTERDGDAPPLPPRPSSRCSVAVALAMAVVTVVSCVRLHDMADGGFVAGRGFPVGDAGSAQGAGREGGAVVNSDDRGQAATSTASPVAPALHGESSSGPAPAGTPPAVGGRAVDGASLEYVFHWAWITAASTGLGVAPFVATSKLTNSARWMGVCNAVAGGMMTAAASGLLWEGVSHDHTGVADVGVGPAAGSMPRNLATTAAAALASGVADTLAVGVSGVGAVATTQGAPPQVFSMGAADASTPSKPSAHPSRGHGASGTPPLALAGHTAHTPSLALTPSLMLTVAGVVGGWLFIAWAHAVMGRFEHIQFAGFHGA